MEYRALLMATGRAAIKGSPGIQSSFDGTQGSFDGIQGSFDGIQGSFDGDGKGCHKRQPWNTGLF